MGVVLSFLSLFAFCVLASNFRSLFTYTTDEVVAELSLEVLDHLGLVQVQIDTE